MACRILLDEQIAGYVRYLRSLAYSDEWGSVSTGIELEFLTFVDQKLEPGTSDRSIWLHCQEHELYLLTDNRNNEGDDSLNEVLQTLNGADSLPVFTIGDRERLNRERSYGERLIEKLLEKLIDSEKYRGVGRVFVP